MNKKSYKSKKFGILILMIAMITISFSTVIFAEQNDYCEHQYEWQVTDDDCVHQCSLCQDIASTIPVIQTGERNMTLTYESAFYAFIPKETAIYHFYTIGNIDSYGDLFDSTFNVIASNDDYYSDFDSSLNFRITMELDAGQIYFIGVSSLWGERDTTLVIEKDCAHQLEFDRIDDNGNCIFKCALCDYVQTMSCLQVGENPLKVNYNEKTVAFIPQTTTYYVFSFKTPVYSPYYMVLWFEGTIMDAENRIIASGMSDENGQISISARLNADELYYFTFKDVFSAVQYNANLLIEENKVYPVENGNLYYSKDGLYGIKINGCDDSVTSLVIPNEIDGLPVTAIADYAFADSNVVSVVLPNNLETLGKCCFHGSKLKNIEIPENVVSVPTAAFECCHELESVTLHEGLASIKEGAFMDCTSLKAIALPDSVTTIGIQAFCDCPGLEEITLSEDLREIGSWAFYNCEHLSLTIPSKVKRIEPFAFKGCNKVNVDPANHYFSSGNGALYDYAKTELIHCPCDAETIELPNTLQTVVSGAFYNCKALTNLVFPEGVEMIENNAFSCCDALESISIPKSTQFIGRGTFRDCADLKDIYFAGTQAEWDSIEKSDDISALNIQLHIQTGTLTDGVADGNVYYRTKENQMIEIIGCDESVTSIDLPDEINGLAVTSVGAEAFKDKEALISVTLPATIESIGKDAFANCPNLATICYKGSAAQWEEIIGEGKPTESETLKLYFDFQLSQDDFNVVPYNDGVAITGYHGIVSDLIVPETIGGKHVVAVTSLKGGEPLTSLTIPEGVVTLGALNSYEEWCGGLKSLSLPSTLTGKLRIFIPVQNIEFPRGNSLITSVELKNDALTDLGAFARLSGLEILRCDCNHITGIQEISGLTNLKTLTISSTDLSSLEGIENLRNLEVLSITDSYNYRGTPLSATELERVSVLSNLKELGIKYNTKITNLNFIRRLRNLEVLALNHDTKLADISALEGKTSLKKIDLSYTAVSDISPLKYMDQLTALTLTGSRVNIMANFDMLRARDDMTLNIGDKPEKVQVMYPVMTYGFSLTVDDPTVVKFSPLNESGTIVTPLKAGKTKVSLVFNGIKTGLSFNVEVVDPNKPVPVESVSIESIPALKIGESVKLNATVLPENATDKTVTWQSSKNEVATVDQSGKVTAVARGTAIITATAGGKTASCAVTVKEDLPIIESDAVISCTEAGTLTGSDVSLDLILQDNPGISYLRLTVIPGEGVTLKSVDNGTIFGDLDRDINLLWSADHDTVAGGKLATLNFEIAEDAPACDCPIIITVQECYNANRQLVEIASVNGKITINDFIYGDANGDKNVNGKDVLLLRKYMAAYNDLTHSSSVTVAKGADADGNGIINGLDVILLRQYMANYDDDTRTSIVKLGPELNN